jgi:hypothetical protein
MRRTLPRDSSSVAAFGRHKTGEFLQMVIQIAAA